MNRQYWLCLLGGVAGCLLTPLPAWAESDQQAILEASDRQPEIPNLVEDSRSSVESLPGLLPEKFPATLAGVGGEGTPPTAVPGDLQEIAPLITQAAKTTDSPSASQLEPDTLESVNQIQISQLERASNVPSLPSGLVASERERTPVLGTSLKPTADCPLTCIREKKHSQWEPSPNPMSQVTNVNELRDVQPSDWAYEALRGLVERYGCLVGYPDQTFRGEKSLSRWEFAAGLNACLNTIERLLQENVSVLQEDINKLQQLAQQFRAELEALGTRLENLESRVTFLEDHQFSTTVFFGGEVIFGLADAWGGEPPGTGDASTVFNYLARVGTVASFTGKDRLRVILSAGNFAGLGFAGPNSLNTYAAFLSYQFDSDNSVFLDSLDYRFAAFDDKVVFTIAPVGFSLSSVLSANSPYFDVGRGSLSRFGEASPILKIGGLTGGFGFDWLLSDRIRLQFAYGTRGSADPERGIFGSDHSALGAQLLFTPTDTVVAGLTYVNAYAEDGILGTFTGSFSADSSGLILEPTQTNAVGASFQWRFVPNLTLGAWGGYTFTQAVSSDGFANTSTYLVSLGWSDAFNREGDLLAFLFGQPPKLEDGRNLFLGEDNATAYHYELFYRYRVTDRIYITPGVFVVTHPGNLAQNNTIVVGVLRTTFRF